ncbi:LacI family DNA-binding transcriptional regulator [Nocardioides sp.]|uniref:LacI family DNA-binding transcriptional regulator n=1 Tax=Nocardioides sp. TaxID=35761 RepID=UPI00286DF753|nr:LacI family DNA-binding transcriptional regulator [Nocardioides sp.]
MSRDAGPSRPPRPTMRDVAALAHVGVKTVSRVINNEGNVSPSTQARVRSAAEKLGFRPNLVASNLRRADGRTATIGLLLEDVAIPFSAALLRAVEDVAQRRGVQVLIASVDEDAARERDFARTLIDRQVDGLLIAPTGRDQSYLIAEQRAGTPIVFLDRVPRLIDADAVVSTNREGAADATEHLVAIGHRRIAYLGDDIGIVTAQQRHDGYVSALAGAGIPVDPAIVHHGVATIDASCRATLDLMACDSPPTAIFASQNLVTVGATKALHRLGLQHTIALVGFDDFALADVLTPGITLVAQDPTEMGRLGATLLFDRLDGHDRPPQTHLIPTRLVVRGSGEIPPSGR